MGDGGAAHPVGREDQPPAVADRARGRAAAPARDRIADRRPGPTLDPGLGGELGGLGGEDVERRGAAASAAAAPRDSRRTADQQPPAVEPRRGAAAPGSQSIRCGAAVERHAPSGRRAASAGATSASCASIQSRCPAAQASALRRDTRRGTVSRTAPVRAVDPQAHHLRAARETFTSSAAGSELMVDQMMLEVAGLVLGDRPAAHRHAGRVHRLAVAADQIMPVGQRLALGAQPVGAGRGQPGRAWRRCAAVSRMQSGTKARRPR